MGRRVDRRGAGEGQGGGGLAQAIRELLQTGLANIGEVTDGGFFEWNVPVDEAIERVRREWMALDHDLWPGDVCWLANTAEGNELAETIFRERVVKPEP